MIALEALFGCVSHVSVIFSLPTFLDIQPKANTSTVLGRDPLWGRVYLCTFLVFLEGIDFIPAAGLLCMESRINFGFVHFLPTVGIEQLVLNQCLYRSNSLNLLLSHISVYSLSLMLHLYLHISGCSLFWKPDASRQTIMWVFFTSWNVLFCVLEGFSPKCC